MIENKDTGGKIIHINSLDSDNTSPETLCLKINKTPSPNLSILAKMEDRNEKITNYFYPEINQFFYDNDVTLEFLNSKLSEYENKNDKDIISI